MLFRSPMPALGAGLVVYGLGRSSRFGDRWLRPAALAFGALALLTVVLAVLFATARWGLGERFVWLLVPICFRPVGGRGRCMRATDSPALAPVGSEAQGSVLAPTAIARCRNWRSDCVVVPLRSPVPTDRPAGLAGSARSAPKGCLFWRSGPS